MPSRCVLLSLSHHLDDDVDDDVGDDDDPCLEEAAPRREASSTDEDAILSSSLGNMTTYLWRHLPPARVLDTVLYFQFAGDGTCRSRARMLLCAPSCGSSAPGSRSLDS